MLKFKEKSGKNMGSSSGVICSKCGEKFTVNVGGGFYFHLLHCNKCGKEKNIGFNELGEIHLRYIKGLGGPYCIASRDQDKKIQESFPGEPLDEKEYHKLVEQFARNCDCGGKFKFSGKPRCPKCYSLKFTLDQNGEFLFYD